MTSKFTELAIDCAGPNGLAALDFLIPHQVILLSDIEIYTVPLARRAFLDQSCQSNWGPMFAMATLALVPVFCFFLAFQRRDSPRESPPRA